MKTKSKKLNNGIRVAYKETPHLNKASFTVLINAGSVYENKKNNGIFHLIEHCVFSGSKKYPNREQVEKKLNELNIIDRVITNREITKYNFSFHSKNSLEVLNFLLEILINPFFDENDIEEEKKIILEEMEADKNDNYILFYSKANKLMFKNTPLIFDPIGTKISLSKIKKSDVVKAHETFYSPNNMIISYAGSLKSDNIFKKLEKYFSGNKKNKLVVYPKQKPIKSKNGNKKHLIKVANNFNFLSFPFLISYLKKSEEDLVYLLKFILDEKIKKKLISDEKISYDAQVNMTEFNKLSILDINCSFSGKNKDRIVELIKKEVDGFVVKERELRYAKNKIYNTIDFTLDDPTDLSEYLAYNFADGILRTPEQEKEGFKKITLSEINDYAKKTLTKRNNFIFISDVEREK